MDSFFPITDVDGVSVMLIDSTELVSPAVVQTLRRKLLAFVDQNPTPRLVVDCSRVQVLSSDAEGPLMTASTRAQSKGGRILICCLRRACFVLLDASKMWRSHIAVNTAHTAAEAAQRYNDQSLIISSESQADAYDWKSAA